MQPTTNLIKRADLSELTTSSSAATLVAKIETVEKTRIESQDKKSKEDKKNSDKLTLAIVGLTKRINDIASGKDKTGGKSADKRFTIKDFIQDKKDKFKAVTSLKGLADMGAARTEGVASAIFGQLGEFAQQREDKKAEASLKQKKKEDFVATVMVGTEYGRSLTKGKAAGGKGMSKERAQQSVLSTYEKREQAIEKRDNLLKAKDAIEAEGKSFGIKTSLNKKQQAELDAAETHVKQFDEMFSTTAREVAAKKVSKNTKSKPADAMSDEEAQEIKDALKEQIRNAILEESSGLPLEQQTLLKKNPDMLVGALEGADSEIQKLTKEQLEQLILINEKLNNNSEEEKRDDATAKEEKIEKKERTVKEKKKEPEQKKEGTLVSKVLDKGMKLLQGPLGSLGKIIKSVPGMLGKMMPGFLKPLGGLLKRALPGVAKLAGKLPGAIGTAAKIASEGSSLLGPAASAAGDVATSMATRAALPALGSMAAAALPVLGSAAAVGAAGLAGYHGAKALGADELGSKIGTKTYDTVDWVKGALGFETDADKMKKAENQAALELGKRKIDAGEKLSPQLAETLKSNGIAIQADQIMTPNTDAAANIRKIDNAQVEGTDLIKTQPNREVLTERISKSDDEKEALKLAKEKRAVTNIVNAPSQVVNNTQHSTGRTNIRNDEPSYTKVLDRRFVY